MKKDNSHPLDPRELRRRAELRLQKSGLIPNSTTSQEDLQRLLHEFPVHQIELEMQNEQLQYAYDAIQQEHKGVCSRNGKNRALSRFGKLHES